MMKSKWAGMILAFSFMVNYQNLIKFSLQFYLQLLYYKQISITVKSEGIKMKSPILYPLLGLTIAAVFLQGCTDSKSGVTVSDKAPCINNLWALPSFVPADSQVTVICYATDPENDPIYYNWNCEDGSFIDVSAGDTARWHAPVIGGVYWVGVEVSDGRLTDEDTLLITVLPGDNYPAIPSDPSPANGEDSVDYANVTLSWACSDPDPGDTLTYAVYMGTQLGFMYLAYSNLTSPTVNAGALAPLTTYYWYVIARDLTLHQTTGPMWSFTTTFPPTINAEFTATQDGSTSQWSPTVVFNSSTLQVGTVSAQDRWNTLIDFDLSSLPAFPVIESATLKLYADGTGIGLPFDVSVSAITEVWNENQLTWNNSPSYDQSCTLPIPNQLSGWIEMDVQYEVQQIVDNGWNYGLAINSSTWFVGDPICMGRFFSSETAYPPILAVTYHER